MLAEQIAAGDGTGQAADLVRRLLSLGSATTIADPAEGTRASRRRPRRSDEVTYRVRIDLTGARPPVWRRLELSSAMFLDQIHQVIQVAFGWTDSHLHRFAGGASVWDRDADLYLCPFDVSEGEDEGTPEQEVRLDEVLVEVGDELFYLYDYGDGWEHVLRLEAVLDRPAGAVKAVCTGGRRAGPPEDCGGVGGYEELVASGVLDADDFDLTDVNAALSLEAERAETAAGLFEPLASLLQRTRGDLVERELSDLARDARLGEAVDMDGATASSMVRRYAWLLERVGDAGIKLTSAGYLPPPVVNAAMVELEMTDEWYGSFNRESQTLPVLALRETAERMGLLRKYRGQLLLTRKAQRLRGDPVRLWWHIAGRLPPNPHESFGQHAGLVSLLGAAAGQDPGSDAMGLLISEVLDCIGWRMADGAALDAWSGAMAARDTNTVLRHMGAFDERDPASTDAVVTSGGALLARAALQRGA
jgi:hypothetical protein